MFKKIAQWFRRPRDSAGHVYYARLKTSQGVFYKVGFTTKTSLVERMAYGGYGDEKLIDCEFFFTFREDAWDVEQTLLDHFGRHRAFPMFSNNPLMPLNGRGQTELFHGDILGLDDALYRLSDQERLEMKQAGGGCLFVLLGIVLIPFTLGLSLFFIAGGASDVFAFGKGKDRDSALRRPQHPLTIQELLRALSAREHASEGEAQLGTPSDRLRHPPS